MQRKFIQNLAFLVLLNILVKPFWLLQIDRTVQNRVGPEEYGLYFALFNFSFLLQMLLDLGISNFNNRNIAQNRQLLSKYFPNIIVIKCGLAFVYLGFTFVLAWAWNYGSYELGLLGILGVNQILASFILYFRSNLAGLHLFKLDAVFSVLDKFLMIVICGILLWGGVTRQPFRIEWFIYAQTASFGIVAVTSGWLAQRKSVIRHFHWNFRFLLVIIRQSYPFALLVVLMTIYTRIDGIMIERFSPVNGSQEAGYYAAAYRILDACNMMSFLFATLLLPIFSRMLKRKEDTGPLTDLSFRMLIVPTLLITITACFFRADIMYGLYKYTIAYSVTIFGVLILSFIPISLVYIYGTLLTANNNMRALNIISLTGVGLNILLNYILIIHYQALGATVATLLTQSLMAAAQMAYAKRTFKYLFPLRLLFQLFGFVLLVALLNWGVRELDLHWLPAFLLTLLAGGGAALLLRLIDIRQVSRLMFREDVLKG